MALNPSPLDLTTVANLQAWLGENVTQSDALQRLVPTYHATTQTSAPQRAQRIAEG